LLRAINERTVLDRIRDAGPVSRAQIARETGLSKPTVSHALSMLERSRLVREAGRSSGGKGPTALLYELNPAAGWVIGIDVGREYVRAAVADLTGQIVAQRRQAARARSARALITTIGTVARAAADRAGISWRRITVAAVGSPGVFRSADHPLLAHNLPGWTREGLLDDIRRELGASVVFENDVNLAALGERWRGLGRDVDDFVYLHVGTGVGLGIVVGGELFRGANGAAGEIGYLPLAAADPHDRANRRRGALETAIGADGVLATARRIGVRSASNAAQVFDAARAGQTEARRAVEIVAEGIALAIAAIVPVLDPALVILGGGIGRNADLLREPLERELRTLLPFRPPLEASVLGEEAELTGAVALALDTAHQRLFARGDAKKGIAV
jgi:predicted NBD/HSP70 family sugar kinase